MNMWNRGTQMHFRGSFLSLILLGNKDKQVTNTARVAPLVVVPSDELDEVVVERDSGLGIEDGRVGVTDEIGRHNIIFSVGHDTLDMHIISAMSSDAGNRLALSGPLEASLMASLIAA